MLPTLRKLRPELYEKIAALQIDMVKAGGKWDEHGKTLAQLADWAENMLVAHEATLERAAIVAEEYDGKGLSPGDGYFAQLGDAARTQRDIVAAIRALMKPQ